MDESGGTQAACQSEEDQEAKQPLGALPIKIVAFAAAGMLALAAGFGLTRLADPPRATPLSAVIPSPARSGGVLAEDDDGIGQDSESNILRATAHGLVHVMSGGRAVGIGLVLTPSGKVLTTCRPSGGSAGLGARYVLSGETFRATVLGTDAAAGLTLLQLQGGDGRPFSTVTVGNSDALVGNAYASQQDSYHVRGEVYDTAVGATGLANGVIINTGLLTGLNEAAAVAGQTRTGLLKSLLQSASGSVIGGPLVNLNGQVIGITLASGADMATTSYAMPINRALAVARQLDARAGHTS